MRKCKGSPSSPKHNVRAGPRPLVWALALVLWAGGAPAVEVGFATDWHVLGPLNDIQPEDPALDAQVREAFAGERADLGPLPVAGAGHPWLAQAGISDSIDFTQLWERRGNAVGCAYAAIHREIPAETAFYLSSDGPASLWVNGERIACVVDDTFPQQCVFEAGLRAGANHCVIAAAPGEEDWCFAFRYAGAAAVAANPLAFTFDALRGHFRAKAPLAGAPWRCQLGDNPAWADPALDDSSWPSLSSQPMAMRAYTEPGEPDIVWWRLHDESPSWLVGRPLFVEGPPEVGVRIYLDGQLVADYPRTMPELLWNAVYRPEGFVPPVDVPEGGHVMAVRWEKRDTQRYWMTEELALVAHNYGAALRRFNATQHTAASPRLHRLILIAVFATLAVFHCAVYVYAPQRPHFFYVLTLALSFLSMLMIHLADGPAWAGGRALADSVYWHGYLPLLPLTALSGLAFGYVAWCGGILRRFWLFAALCVVAYIAAHLRHQRGIVISVPTFIAAEFIRVYFAKVCWKRRQSAVIGFGLCCVVLGVLATGLAHLFGISPTTGLRVYVGWYGYLGFLLFMSIYVAREYTDGMARQEILAEALKVRVNQQAAELRAEIAERRRSERRRASIERQVRKMRGLESLEAMAAGIAHELNNILMGIIGNADLLKRNMDKDSLAAKSVHAIHEAGWKAAGLVRQMLAYAGKGQLNTVPSNLDRVLGAMRPELDAAAGKCAPVEFRLTEELPETLVDVQQLEQVMRALVSNAAEAQEEEQASILLSAECVELGSAELADTYVDDGLPAGRYVAIAVSDKGGGMTTDTADRVFDPFFTTRFPGRGLGLTAALGIIRAHQGAVKLLTSPGQGATFTVFLPCRTDLNPAGKAAGGKAEK